MAQVLKEEVRNRILIAAEKVFYEKDYRGAKLTEIAKEADIPVALIYTYFKNKEVLFDAVISSVYVNFESAFNDEESLEKAGRLERTAAHRHRRGRAGSPVVPVDSAGEGGLSRRQTRIDTIGGGPAPSSPTRHALTKAACPARR